MKKLIFILLFLLFSGTVYAESVTLVWTPSPSPNIAEYRVYQSLIHGVFAIGPECNAVAITDDTNDCTTKAVVSDLIAGYRYHFVVTAVDETGNESEPSNMVSITIDPANANPSSSGLGTIQATIQ